MLTQGPPSDPKCKLNILSSLTLPHLASTLSHLYQEFCVNCIFIESDEVVDSYQGVGGGTEGGYYLIVFLIFVCGFVFWSLMVLKNLCIG